MIPKHKNILLFVTCAVPRDKTLVGFFYEFDWLTWLRLWVLSQAETIIATLLTVKSLSEALIFSLTNPQYDDRLFIVIQVQYIEIPSSNLGRTSYVQKLFWMSETISVHNMFSQSLSLEFSCIELQWTICRHIVG